MNCKKSNIALLILLFAAITLTTGIFIWRKPLAIKYHRYRIEALFNEEPEPHESLGLVSYGDKWSKAFDLHRDRLTELGYHVKKEFQLQTIKSPSLRFKRLWEELCQRFPDNPFAIGSGYNSNEPAVIIVWETPDKMHEWEKIIKAHDALPTNEVMIPDIRNPDDILPFIGSWVDEEGNISFTISRDDEAAVRIECPPIEEWTVVFRNIHFQDQQILFDWFLYTDPRDELKLKTNKSGHHPFSGVRSETTLKINPSNQNELIQNLSAFSKYGPLTDMNHPNAVILKRLEVN